MIGYNPTARTDIKAGLVDILFTKAYVLQQQLNDGNRAFDTEQQKLQHQFNEMYKLVLRVEEESKNNLTLSANLAGFYFKMGNNEKGIEHLNHTIKLSPFEPSLWHSKVKLYFDLARFFYNQADDESAKKYLAKVLYYPERWSKRKTWIHSCLVKKTSRNITILKFNV